MDVCFVVHNWAVAVSATANLLERAGVADAYRLRDARSGEEVRSLFELFQEEESEKETGVWLTNLNKPKMACIRWEGQFTYGRYLDLWIVDHRETGAPKGPVGYVRGRTGTGRDSSLFKTCFAGWTDALRLRHLAKLHKSKQRWRPIPSWEWVRLVRASRIRLD